LAVIDEKLIRMKELAEQAATGTYTTAQREIINSEYQAMAREIDRIANATNFNGVKLLDGSISNQHGGQGLKIHFGAGNNAAEDYYFINIGDARATSNTGLRAGGDAKNDIWGQGASGADGMGGPGCCTAGFTSLNNAAGFVSGQSFSYGYNWDWMEDKDTALLSGKYLAGRYTVSGSDSLQDLVDKVNAGTQSRVGIKIDPAGAGLIASGGNLAVCLGDEAYFWGDSVAALGGSAATPRYEYTFTTSALYRVENLFTNSAGLAQALGLSEFSLKTIVENAENSAAAAEALKAALAGLAKTGQLLTSSDKSAFSVASAFSAALAYMTLESAGGAPKSGSSFKLEDVLQFFTGKSSSSAFGAVTASAVAGWAIDPLQQLTEVVGNIWVNGENWTSDGALAEQKGWQRLKVKVESGDTYQNIADKFTALTSGAAGKLTQEWSWGLASGVSAGTQAFLWYSNDNGLWTKEWGVACALGFTDKLEYTLAAGDTPVKALEKINAAIGTTVTANKEVLSTSVAPPIEGNSLSLGFWHDSQGNWTDNREVATALGFTQGRLENLEYNMKLEDIAAQLRPLVESLKTYIGTEALTAANLPAVTPDSLTSQRIADKITHIGSYIDTSKEIARVGDGTETYFNAESLASAINHNAESKFWAMLDQNDDSILYVFRKDGGDNNHLLACDVAAPDEISRKLLSYASFENVENGLWHDSGTTFTLGTTAADVWGTLKPIQTKSDKGNEVWNVTLNGRDVGQERDLWIAAAGELKLPGLEEKIINGLDRHSFVEIQNASNGQWAGADVRTQSNAQAALEALSDSINIKDKIRADLGAMQNRLENTMANLEIQMENLQASESRISDVDVAKEMTEFTKNNVLVQASVGMLAQANSMSQLALSLIGR
jgi:flagellin-like hook-associated protein FlgL